LQNIFSSRYLYCVYCHQWFMTESILYEWKHVQQNICSGLVLQPFWMFSTKILLLYIKIINHVVCKTFFQPDTFTVSIVTNDSWMDPFGMSASMYNKIFVVDYVLQPFWMLSYQNFVALHKTNNQVVCKTFFQANTFTVSIVTNDIWLNPFWMSGSMYNKIYVVD